MSLLLIVGEDSNVRYGKYDNECDNSKKQTSRMLCINIRGLAHDGHDPASPDLTSPTKSVQNYPSTAPQQT